MYVEHKHGQVVSKPIEAAALKGSEENGVAIKHIGITPKDRSALSIEQSDHWEVDVSDNTIDLHLVFELYICCIKKFQIIKSLSAIGPHYFKGMCYDFYYFQSLCKSYVFQGLRTGVYCSPKAIQIWTTGC